MVAPIGMSRKMRKYINSTFTLQTRILPWAIIRRRWPRSVKGEIDYSCVDDGPNYSTPFFRTFSQGYFLPFPLWNIFMRGNPAHTPLRGTFKSRPDIQTKPLGSWIRRYFASEWRHNMNGFREPVQGHVKVTILTNQVGILHNVLYLSALEIPFSQRVQIFRSQVWCVRCDRLSAWVIIHWWRPKET